MIDSKSPIVMFTAEDRCDRCNAQAYMLTYRDGFELTFCLHHAKKHVDNLIIDGWKVVYDTAAIEALADDNKVVI